MTQGAGSEWFDDDAFWVECYPFMYPEHGFAQATKQADALLALAAPQGRCVLDLCCGPGRFAVPLAERGCRVTGVDRTAFCLDRARERAQAAKVDVEWVLSDMRAFARPEAFDLALCLGTSFGYFRDAGDEIRVLANLNASLRPGGACVIDVRGKERIARQFQPTTSDTLPDGSLLIQRNEVRDDWTRIRTEWIVVRGDRARRFMLDVAIYSGRELVDRLERAGFRDVALYGSLDGDRYGLDSERLIAVARN